MKNKKILSRILALCSVAVLLFALALPCFADAPSDSDEELIVYYNSLPDSMKTPAFDDFLSIYGNDVFSYDTLVSGTFYNGSVDTGLLQASFFSSFSRCVTFGYMKAVNGNEQYLTAVDGNEFYVGFHFLGSEGNPVFMITSDLSDTVEPIIAIEYSRTLDADSTIILTPVSIRINGVSMSFGLFDIIQFGFVANDDSTQLMNTIPLVLFNNAQVSHPTSFSQGYTTGYNTNRPDGVVPPAKTGLFGQLYYILSDAIYGENVVLGSTQDFALTLVTTLLVLCVVLLPVLLVVAIMFKLFRW